MSRLKNRIRSIRDRGDKVLGIFVTAGFPEKQATAAILQAIDAGGADFIELGMPFSDPLAVGETIQRSSKRALENGVGMDFTFKSAAEFRENSDTPILLMGYINPVLQFGLGNFFDACHSTGVDAVILPDFPLKARLPVLDEARKHGIDVIHLVAPTTSDERMHAIDLASEGFVYAVSMTGLTGTQMPERDVVNSYLQRVSAQVDQNPVLVGFGIRSGRDVRELSCYTDGCIVGSAVLRLVDELWKDEALSGQERLKRL